MNGSLTPFSAGVNASARGAAGRPLPGRRSAAHNQASRATRGFRRHRAPLRLSEQCFSRTRDPFSSSKCVGSTAARPAVGQSLIVTLAAKEGKPCAVSCSPSPSSSLPLAAGAVAQPQRLTAQPAAPPPHRPASSSTRSNRTVDPCTDFYQFACGGWIAKNPIPADRPRWGRFDELQERNFEILRRILETRRGGATAIARRSATTTPPAWTRRRSKPRGSTPLAPDLATIDALAEPGRSAGARRRTSTASASPAFFRFGSQTDLKDATNAIAERRSGRPRPARPRLLLQDRRALGRAPRASTSRTSASCSRSPARPPNRRPPTPKAVMRDRNGAGKAALDRVTRRDPANAQHHDDAQRAAGADAGFNWRATSAASARRRSRRINVAVPEFFKALNQLIAASADRRSQGLSALAPAARRRPILLPKAFVDEDFDFFSRTLAGQQEQRPRWRRCVTQTDSELGEALGKAFVEETFGPQAKADMLQMVQDIKSAHATGHRRARRG